MGKNRHARTKSTEKHSKKKRENSGRRTRENDVEVFRSCDEDETEKKSLWAKWAGFLRLFKKQRKNGNDDLNSSKKDSTGNLASAVSSMDLIEISTEPSDDISQMVIKANEGGIETMMGEVEESSSMAPKVEEAFFAAGEERKKEENVRLNRRRWSWDTEIVKNEAQMRENLGEAQAPGPCAGREANISDECIEINETQLSKTIKINQREIRYSFIGQETGESRKTVSEPTWNEKKKMLRRKRLHEDLNELLEQFMFLEEEDVINFSGFQSKGVLDSKRTSLGGQSSFVSENRREPLLKLSRKVSPEILVNIKPFKEYLSGSFLDGTPPELASVEELLRAETEEKEDGDVERPRARERAAKEEVGKEREKRKSEDEELRYHCPAIRSKVHFADDAREKEETSKVAEAEPSEESNSEICAVFGVYKTYPGPKVLRNASLEEVLENLDDKDHDLIFKKNMTQFKKKINSKQRFDKRKVGPITETIRKIEVENKKMRKQEHKVQVFDAIPEVDSVVFVEKVARKHGLLAVQNVGPEPLWPKVLSSLMASEACALLNRVMVYRVESSLLLSAQRSQTFGDRRDASERKEYLMTREQAQKEEAVPAPEHLDSLFGFDPMKNLNGIAKLMSFGKHQFLNKFFCERTGLERRVEVAASSDFVIPKYFSKPLECFYVLENYTFTSFDNESGPKLEPKLSKEALTAERPAPKGQTAVTSTWAFSPEASKQGQRAIKILTDTSCEVAISIENSPIREVVRCSSSAAVGRKLGEEIPSLFFGSQVFNVNISEKAGGAAEGEKGGGSEKKTADGFEVIFDGAENKELKTESTKTLKTTSKDSGFFFYEAPTLEWETEEERKKNVNFPQVCRLEIFESGDEKTSVKLLKFKSNSSPKESILQTECSFQESHRQRRPLNFSKEKLDAQKKKRHADKEMLSALKNSDKGDEVRIVGSPLVECRAPKGEGPLAGCLETVAEAEGKSFSDGERKVGGRGRGRAGGSDERKAVAVALRDGEKRVAEEGRERKVFVLEKEGTRVRREVLAAVQSIKERRPCKEEAGGGGERTFVVIMLSKK